MTTGSPPPLAGNRDFARLWAGSGISAAGNSITDVALPLMAVLYLHASTFAVAALVAAEQAAWLFLGLVAGVWVDRWRRRPVLVGTDLARLVLVGSIPLAALFGALTLAQLYLVALLAGACNVFFSIAHAAYLPALVHRGDLTAANSRLSATTSGADLAGRAAGGLLVQLTGGPAALVIDAATFAVSAGCVRGITAPEPPAEPAAEPAGSGWRRLSSEIRAGLRYTFGDPALRIITVSNAVSNFCTAAQYALTFVFLARVLGLPSGAIGVLLASSGVGGLLGAAVAGRLTRRWSNGTVWRAALVVGPLFGLLIPAARSGLAAWPFAVGSLGLTAAVVVTNVITGSFRQAICPPRLLGRLAASSRMLTWSVIPLGALLAGGLAAVVDIRTALWLIAAGFFGSPLLVLTSPLARVADLDPAG